MVRGNSVLLTFYLASQLVIGGCASISTNGTLPDIKSYGNLPDHKPSVALRYYAQTVYSNAPDGPIHSIELDSPSELNSALNKLFVDSGAFSEVKQINFGSDQVILQDLEGVFAKKLLVESVSKVGTDFFFNIVNNQKPHLPKLSWNSLLCIPFVLTIGFLPCPKPYEAEMVGTLYDNNGKIIETFKVEDRATVWAWTPLLVLPGAAVLKPPQVAATKVVLKAAKHLLQDLLKSGRLK